MPGEPANPGSHASSPRKTCRNETCPDAPRLKAGLAKVPEITALFWALKLLTTGMGEAMADFLGHQSIPLAALIGIFGLWLALRLQLRQSGYRAAYYWFAVMMVAVFGTMVADAIRIGAGVGYDVTTPVFALITGAIFLVWYRSEGTLSIHAVNTRRRERFYWLAVLATFALGTAAGDLTAYQLHLGFWASVVLFAVLIAIPALMWWRGTMHPIFAFWFAYVITRPLGASFADGFSKPTSGGLHLGDGTVSAVALVIFVALVAYVARTRRDVQRAAEQVSDYPYESHEPRRLGLTPATEIES